mmetsp:Transcript_6567/g.21265  ORF Transcript_6567/g.21265 Transcript_6567/m.21265 type:complete len:276 (-) Transcript_6567:697-1524(-)
MRLLFCLFASLAFAQDQIDCANDGRPEGCDGNRSGVPTSAPSPATTTGAVTHDADGPTPPPATTPSPTPLPRGIRSDDEGDTAIQPVTSDEEDEVALLVSTGLILLGGCALLAFVLSRLRGDLQEINARRRRRAPRFVGSSDTGAIGTGDGARRPANGVKSPRRGGGGGHRYGALPPPSAEESSQSESAQTHMVPAESTSATSSPHYQDVQLAQAQSTRTAYGETKLAPAYSTVPPAYDSVDPLPPVQASAYGETSLWRQSVADASALGSAELKR